MSNCIATTDESNDSLDWSQSIYLLADCFQLHSFVCQPSIIWLLHSGLPVETVKPFLYFPLVLDLSHDVLVTHFLFTGCYDFWPYGC